MERERFERTAAADGDTGLAYEARNLLRELTIELWCTASLAKRERIIHIRPKAWQRYQRRRAAQHKAVS